MIMLCTVVEFKVKLKLSLPRKIEPNYRNHRSFFFSRVAFFPKYLNNRNRQSFNPSIERMHVWEKKNNREMQYQFDSRFRSTDIYIKRI